jgi:hypothetical protein
LGLTVAVATTLLRHRIVEDLTNDKGLKLGLVSKPLGLVLRNVAGKLRLAFAASATAVYERGSRFPRSPRAACSTSAYRVTLTT